MPLICYVGKREIDMDKLDEYPKKLVAKLKKQIWKELKDWVRGEKNRKFFCDLPKNRCAPRRAKLIGLILRICYCGAGLEERSSRKVTAGNFKLSAEINFIFQNGQRETDISTRVSVSYKSEKVFDADISVSHRDKKILCNLKCYKDLPGDWEKELRNGWDEYWDNFLTGPMWQSRVLQRLGNMIPVHQLFPDDDPNSLYNIWYNAFASFRKRTLTKKQRLLLDDQIALMNVLLIFKGVLPRTYKTEGKDPERIVSDSHYVDMRSVEDTRPTLADLPHIINDAILRDHWKNDLR